jgi:hypothetical protein
MLAGDGSPPSGSRAAGLWPRMTCMTRLPGRNDVEEDPHRVGLLAEVGVRGRVGQEPAGLVPAPFPTALPMPAACGGRRAATGALPR